MGIGNFSDDFERDAVAQITGRATRKELPAERDIVMKATAYCS